MIGCRDLTPAEAKKLGAQLSRGRLGVRNAAIFWFGVRTGARIAEILSLRVRDVFVNGRLVDAVQLQRCNTKGKKRGRVVDLSHPDVRSALSALLLQLRGFGRANATDWLFQSQKGGRMADRSAYWRHLKAAATAAGLRDVHLVACHSMRKCYAARIHAGACELLAQGTAIDPLLETSFALGHESINSTVSYLRGLGRPTVRKIIASAA